MDLRIGDELFEFGLCSLGLCFGRCNWIRSRDGDTLWFNDGSFTSRRFKAIGEVSRDSNAREPALNVRAEILPSGGSGLNRIFLLIREMEFMVFIICSFGVLNESYGEGEIWFGGLGVMEFWLEVF